MVENKHKNELEKAAKVVSFLGLFLLLAFFESIITEKSAQYRRKCLCVCITWDKIVFGAKLFERLKVKLAKVIFLFFPLSLSLYHWVVNVTFVLCYSKRKKINILFDVEFTFRVRFLHVFVISCCLNVSAGLNIYTHIR